MNKSVKALLLFGGLSYVIAITNQFIVPIIWMEVFSFHDISLAVMRAIVTTLWVVVIVLAYRMAKQSKRRFYWMLLSAPICFWWLGEYLLMHLFWSIKGFAP